MSTVFFILGMHRSGTSALGGVLNAMGLDVGASLMPATDTNPKGYFENKTVYWHNEKILKEANSSWSDHMFDIESISELLKQKYIQQAIKIIGQEYKNSNQFIIKDPRICMLFPIWEAACKAMNIDIKIIIPYRNPSEVAQSLSNRNSFSNKKGLILWLKHFYLSELYSRKYPRVFLSFDVLLDSTDVYLKELENITNIKITKDIRQIINGFLEKDYKHINIPIKSFKKNIPKFLIKTLNALRKSDFSDLKSMDKIRNEFQYNLQLFHYQEIDNNIQKQKELQLDCRYLSEKINVLNNQSQNNQVQINNLLNQNSTLNEKLTTALSNLNQVNNQVKETQNSLIEKSNELNRVQSKHVRHLSSLQNQVLFIKAELKRTFDDDMAKWQDKLKNNIRVKNIEIENIQLFHNLYINHVEVIMSEQAKYIGLFYFFNPIWYLNKKKLHEKMVILKNKFYRVPWSVVKNFHAQQYLFQNNEVDQAIKNSVFSHALEHFILFGYDEVNAGIRTMYKDCRPYKTKNLKLNSIEGLEDFRDYLVKQNKCIKKNEKETPDAHLNLSLLDNLDKHFK